jgi:uncharacterized membrane protein YphA (DoxX/SURF4 family)
MSKPSWNPLKCAGTDLPLNLTILVKALAIALLVTNHVTAMPDPWLPFIPGVDLIPPSLFQWTLRIALVTGSLAIVFNRRVRLASLVVGTTMLVAILSSKAYYGNNKTFCGLMFFLAGLHQPGGPHFIRWQLALTYFGAGLNKALDGDWHSGVFFHNWAVNRLRHPWYIAVDSRLPPLVLGKIMCWTTIVAELGSVPMLMVPRLFFWGNLANILFQAGLLLFTGTTFTLFFYGMSAASLAFVVWPSRPLQVVYDPASQLAVRAKRFFSAWDLDGQYDWTARSSDDSPVHFQWRDKTYRGFQALRMLVLFNPITYFAIAASVAGAAYVPSAPLVRRLIVGGLLVLLLPPLAWLADVVFHPRSKHVPRLAHTAAGE